MPGRVTALPAPRFSSQSNPTETHHIRIIEEEFRTLRSQLEQQYGVRIIPEQPIFGRPQRYQNTGAKGMPLCGVLAALCCVPGFPPWNPAQQRRDTAG
eukprot:6957187-Alexandrium_andersonii.AAC.1